MTCAAVSPSGVVCVREFPDVHTDHATSDGELWAVPVPTEKRRRDFVHNTVDAPFPPVPASAHILNDPAEHGTGWCPNCRAALEEEEGEAHEPESDRHGVHRTPAGPRTTGRR